MSFDISRCKKRIALMTREEIWNHESAQAAARLVLKNSICIEFEICPEDLFIDWETGQLYTYKAAHDAREEWEKMLDSLGEYEDEEKDQ